MRVEEIANYQPEQAATFGARLARSFNGSLSSLVSAAEALAVFIAGSAPWLALLVGVVTIIMFARRRIAWRRP